MKPPEQRRALFAAWFAFCALVALGFMSFAGWLAYLLVMHSTHGGAS
jgi:hypothetical protein